MKEGNKFYSIVIPVNQHERMVQFSRKNGISVAKLVRRGIDLMLEGCKDENCKVDRV